GEVECIWCPFSCGFTGNYSYIKGGVGSLSDMAIHGITLCWFLIGFDFIPERVKSISPGGISVRIKDRIIDDIFRDLDVEDYANFVVEFQNPLTGQWINIYIEGSWSYRSMQSFKVVGSKGEIGEKDGAIEIKDVFDNSRSINISHPAFLNSYLPPGYTGFPQEIKAMIKYIRENKKPLCDEKIAAESLAIAQSAYLSEAKGRKAISINEFKEYAKKFKGDPDSFLQELLEKGIRK
ncbi:MAG: hypothetical protein K8S14_04150, partial [Actinomycetia bacterium]|nr:hypothetical protein [Actinomycetes bacterium]